MLYMRIYDHVNVGKHICKSCLFMVLFKTECSFITKKNYINDVPCYFPCKNVTNSTIKFKCIEHVTRWTLKGLNLIVWRKVFFYRTMDNAKLKGCSKLLILELWYVSITIIVQYFWPFHQKWNSVKFLKYSFNHNLINYDLFTQ